MFLITWIAERQGCNLHTPPSISQVPVSFHGCKIFMFLLNASGWLMSCCILRFVVKPTIDMKIYSLTEHIKCGIC